MSFYLYMYTVLWETWATLQCFSNNIASLSLTRLYMLFFFTVIRLDQWFQTFFGLRHTLHSKKFRGTTLAQNI